MLTDEETQDINEKIRQYKEKLITEREKAKEKDLVEVVPGIWEFRSVEGALLELRYKHIEKLKYSPLYLIQNIDNKEGLLDAYGRVVLKPRFDSIISSKESFETTIKGQENDIKYLIKYESKHIFGAPEISIVRAPVNRIEELIYSLNDKEGYDELDLYLHGDHDTSSDDLNELIKLLRNRVDELEIILGEK